jgi:hypothetical protein
MPDRQATGSRSGQVISVSVSFHPSAGQVALIAPASNDQLEHDRRLIGIVSGTVGTLTVVGLSVSDLADGSDIVVSIFTGEGLYKIRALARWDDPGELTIDPIREVELIQRRRWPRRPIHLDVAVARSHLERGDHSVVAGQTLDVSMGGIRVATDRRLPPGTDLEVTISLPDGRRMVARSTVVYAFVKDDAFEYRLAFDQLSDAGATSLDALVGIATMPGR